MEMIHQIGCSLYPCISQFTYLFAVKSIPTPSIVLLVEIVDEFGMIEVDKGIPNIASIGVVNWKVQEIDLHFVVSTNLLVEHFFRVFIRYMANHQRCSSVRLDLIKICFTFYGMILY